MAGAAFSTTYADLGLLRASLAGARPGQGFVYAVGPALDPAHPVTKLVQGLVKDGAARTNICGRDLDGRLKYRVTALAPASQCPGNPVAEAFTSDPKLPAMLDLLKELAAASAPCPSLRVLAQMVRLQDRHAAAYRLRRLGQLGLVDVTTAEDGSRVVRIVETGLTTGRGKNRV